MKMRRDVLMLEPGASEWNVPTIPLGYVRLPD